MDNFLLWPRAIAAALTDAAFALAFGLLLSSLWLAPNPLPALHRHLHRSLWACVAAMLLALPAQIFLMTASMLASTSWTDLRPMLAAAITDTHAGRNLLLQTALLLLLTLTLAVLRGPTRTYATLAALLLLAAARAASGHAASAGDFTLRELTQWIHLTSIAIWSGSILAAGLIAVPTLLRAHQTQPTLVFLRRLSRAVTLALALVIASGIVNAWHGLGGALSPLAHTQWGYLLDAKSALVLAALTLGGLNRRILRPNAPFGPPQTARITTILRTEALLMLLILIVSAFLANSPPADMASMSM
jgi:putative copper resistance protein D